jgi:Family of unknown function (DUF6152)
MRIPGIAATVLMVVLAVGAAGARAHHGWSGYDSAKPLQLEGVIKDSGYEHPHGYVHLEAVGKLWTVVLAPPSRMENRGLAPAMLKAGVKAKVEGYPSRSDPGELRAERITVDGKTIELR